MVKRILLTLLMLAVVPTVAGHPLHVSVLNITIQDDKIVLALSTFVDDWETAYFHYHGVPFDLTKKENYEGEWFETYFRNALQLKTKKEASCLPIEIDSIWFNDMNMYMEMHIPLRRNLKSLYIYNGILTDVFFDQTNLVVISKGRRERGIKFDYNKKEEAVELK